MKTALQANFAGVVLALALQSQAGQAQEYISNPVTAEQAREQIALLNKVRGDAVWLINDAMNASQRAEPVAKVTDGALLTCFTLAATGGFGLDYGPGQINTKIMEPQLVAAIAGDDGYLRPLEASPGNYFPNFQSFMKTHRSKVDGLDYADVEFPQGTFIGCDQSFDWIRDDLHEVNLQLLRGFLGRIDRRMDEDRARAEAVLEQPQIP